MKEVLDKISSYNLFNYLLPGILFIFIADNLTSYSFWQENLIIGAFLAYFVGLVISRFGSLIVEPILKKVSFLKFSDYEAFISTSKKDPKIELLSESNNMYRTISAMLILVVLVKISELIELKYPILKNLNPYLLIALLLIMFLYSYKKQTEYITKRIKANNR